MKNNLFIRIFKIRKDNVFVHIISNIIILCLLLCFDIGCLESAAVPTAAAPIYRGDASQKKVCLMVNVYWGEEYIPQMLDIFEKYNAKCTFFVGGCWAAKNIPLLKTMALDHEIGNHGYLHKDHRKLSVKENTDEILVCEKLIYEATGQKTCLFAPPSGSIGENMLSVCAQLGYKVIMWSKDTIDWRDNDYQLVYKRATKDLQNGDLILMHPMPHTVKALPMILEYYAQYGFKTVTVGQMVNVADMH